MNQHESNMHKNEIHQQAHKTKKQKKKTWYVVMAILAVVGGVILGFVFKPATQAPQETFVVDRGVIAQDVVVTGRVKAAEDVELAFERGGKIKNVNVKIGDRVSPGQALAYLDISELQAQLLQAQANVDAQRAKLEELKSGSRPEELQIKESDLKKAEQDLSNLYGSINDVVNDAYIKADDAVRSKTDTIFVNDDSENPELTFLTSDAQVHIDATTLRKVVGGELVLWKKAITNSESADIANIENILLRSEEYLSVIRDFLFRSLDAVNAAINISQTTIDSFKTNLGVARINVNSAASAITNHRQLISTQKVVVERINNELLLARAGSTQQAIAAQDAQVKQAEANVATILAQIAKATLVSPIRGIVTKQDAKAGEIVAPNVPLVSIISDRNLEIEANIPEVDIGSIQVSNIVQIVLDAFPGEKFVGKVSYIDPAETVKDGVVNFKVTIAFDEANEKIRSGLTANLNIETERKENVLIIPQFAVIENDSGAFVKKWENSVVVETPVVLGVRDSNGKVEVLSGLNQGDVIVNVGIKNGK
ncbi:efflux RND transporter periplasmic adaptor subunit [Candidatus Parcubacteria bacterium]|jgi:HlyD family secretion protein|nr:MAG: efflux RND transporter periplasmic adaptor subunit [Candidatus Parcubacteria bacterium]